MLDLTQREGVSLADVLAEVGARSETVRVTYEQMHDLYCELQQEVRWEPPATQDEDGALRPIHYKNIAFEQVMA